MLSQHIVSLDLNDVSLKTCLKTIRHETGVGFLYSGRDINKVKNISVNVINERLDEVLNQILLDNGFTYKIQNEVILIRKIPAPIPEPVIIPENKVQEKSIQGVVSDEDGNPLPGVNVVAKGTSIGTITDANGHYFITVPLDAQTLEFSFVGMQTQEVAIGNSTVIDISMQIAMEAMEEVVVTAFGIERETKALGFSAQELQQPDFAENRDISVVNYLTGKVAGVHIRSTAGGVGGSSYVSIRGNSSLRGGNNQPLYVVDGIPIDNSHLQEASRGGGNDFGDGISNINPDDVESISVLKGPNAAALYGARGSNGVILITTKSGEAKKRISVEINSNITIDRLSMFPKVQNMYALGYGGVDLDAQWVDIDGTFYPAFNSGAQDSHGPPLDGRLIVDPFDPTQSTVIPLVAQPEDNLRDFYETGVTNTNTVAIAGGNEIFNARASISDMSAKGITPNHKVNRQTFNLRTSGRITDKFTFDAKVNYIQTKGENRPNLGQSLDNPVRLLTVLGRHLPLDMLKENSDISTGIGGALTNPYYIVENLTNEDVRNRFIGFLSLKYQFNDWLNLMARSGTDFYTTSMNKRWPVGSFGRNNRDGRLLNNTYNVQESNSDILLTASKEITSNFSTTLSVGANRLTKSYERTGWDARVFKSEGVYDVSNAEDVRPDYHFWKKEIQSVYFMGQFGYSNFLFLDVTGRNDWSSTLGENNYSFFYPSVSASFIITDALNINSDILTFGKIRASYAHAGNDADPHMTVAGYRSYTNTFGGQGFSSVNSTIPLLDLQNEMTKSYEFGMDLRLFKNRLSLDVTYYNGVTENQILPINLSGATGYGSVVVNAGKIENKGIEIILNVNPVRLNNSFRWDVSFNYAKNNSMILELASGLESYRLYSGLGTIEARVGHPYGDIVGRPYIRNDDGRRIVASNGAYPKAKFTEVVGNITPDWIGGLNNTFSFKGFALSCLIDIVTGGEMLSDTRSEMAAKGTGKFTLEGREDPNSPFGAVEGVVEVLDAEGNVTGYEENTNEVPAEYYWGVRAWRRIAEEFVLDASYISLREVSLSYTLKPLLKKSPFSSVRLSLIGRNLFYFKEHTLDMGISPESSSINSQAGAQGIEALSLPSTRSFGLNINLMF